MKIPRGTPNVSTRRTADISAALANETYLVVMVRLYTGGTKSRTRRHGWSYLRLGSASLAHSGTESSSTRSLQRARQLIATHAIPPSV